MSKKKFRENWNEIMESTTGKTGKPVRSFSKADYKRLTTSMLNDLDFSVDVPKKKEGKTVYEKVYVTRDFRNYITEVAIDAFSVDKNEAYGLMDKYEFKESDALYPFVSESIYQFATTGKKFEMLPKADFSGGFIIDKVAESITEYTAPSTKEKGRIRKGEHYKLKAKSKVPKDLKTKL
jgi:hypothetical protein